MVRLDFVGIGCQRSGTSWLFNCLIQHPAIRGPVAGAEKEVNFFNHHYTRGYHWYHSLFEFGPWKTGEFSVLYAPETSVPERLRRYRADILLIACIRNPIDRAFSHHLHEIRRGRVPLDLYNFEDAVESNPTYIDQGRYFTNLSRYFEVFSPDQIHIVVFDDVVEDPARVAADAYRFLGEDPCFQPTIAKEVVNAAQPTRSKSLERAVRAGAELVRRTAGERAYIGLKRSRLVRQVVRSTRRDFDKDEVPPMSETVRAELRRVFASEIEGLTQLLGRDLSHWVR